MLLSGQFALGLSMATLFCFFSAAGFTMQRKAHMLNQESSGCSSQTLWVRRPLWFIGVVIYTSAALFDALARSMLPQLICICAGCFRLALVTAMGHIFLREHAGCRAMIGVSICAVGTAVCLCLGPRPNTRDPRAQQQLWAYVPFGASLLVALIVGELIAGRPLTVEKPHAARSGLRDLVLPAATALASALSQAFNAEIGLLDTAKNEEDQLAWALCAAGIAVFSLACFGLNMRGAQRFPVQVFAPTVFAFNTCIEFFTSMAIFGEYRNLEPWRATLSASGALASFVGALCIQPPDLSIFGAGSREPTLP